MTTVYSNALEKSIKIERLIGHIKGIHPGPTLIFTGRIHGNEPSGVLRYKKLFKKFKKKK